MAANGLDLPEWLHKLFTEVNLEGITQAMTNVTLKDFTHLVDFVKGRELNADTITKLFEEANKLSGAGTAFAAACLVFSVIHICFPWALTAPFLNMIGFTVANLAPGTYCCCRLLQRICFTMTYVTQLRLFPLSSPYLVSMLCSVSCRAQ